MTFLVLRPQAKCTSSANAFHQADIPAVACGLIDTVVDEAAVAQLKFKIGELADSQLKSVYVIVTSTVAAEQCIQFKSLWPQYIQFFSVGSSTANILINAGLTVVVPQEARSEGLLNLSQLKSVENQNIIIMKGFGGRELLRDTLEARGANVAEWEVYKRIKMPHPVFTQDWHASQIRCIIATSGEVIQAAFEYFDVSWLKSVSWIVVSQRTADIATKLGITQLSISQDASDQALIKCAQQWLTRARHSSEH